MLNDLPEQSQCVSHKVWGVLIKAKFLRNFHWLSHQERTHFLPCRPQPWWWPWGRHPSRFWGPPHWSPVLWSQYQPVEFASDLVFTITWTKTRKFLKRRFSKRPDKLISNAIQAKFNFNSIQSLLCLPIRSEVSASFSSAGTWSTMMLISWVLMVTINLWYLARLAHDIAALNRLELQVSGHPWNRHWPLYI